MLAPITPTERPAERLIRRFEPRMLEDRTIANLLEKGFTLVICCKACPRMIQWTPPELERRLGQWTGLKLADLTPKLTCKGEGGCGADEVALFPVLYEGDWKWPHWS